MNSQTAQSAYQLGFIGAGKLAGSIIRGLVRARFCEAKQILISEPDENARTTLQTELGISVGENNRHVGEQARLILLGIKPAMVQAVLAELAPVIQNKPVISLAAGIRLKDMENTAGARLMRAMTNTPSAVCHAATGLVRGTRTTEADFELARKMFSAVGVVVDVHEEQIDAVTALSGSGPAFIYTIIEALAQGGTKMGLAQEVALTLATEVVFGAAQLARESRLSPEALRAMVVTPGGTTAAGLAVMEKAGTAASLTAAVEAAAKRGQEMSGEARAIDLNRRR